MNILTLIFSIYCVSVVGSLFEKKPFKDPVYTERTTIKILSILTYFRQNVEGSDRVNQAYLLQSL